MSPFIGGLALVAGAIAIAVLIGAAVGVIHGRLKGDLALGATLAIAAYLLVVIAFESWSSWKLIIFGLLPLLLSYTVGTLTTQFLESRLGLRPVLATLAAFGSALLVGFFYLMSIRFDWMPLVDPNIVWIGLGVLSSLIVLSILKRVRAKK